MKRGQETSIIAQVLDIVSNWREYARDADIPKQTTETIYRALRLEGFK